MTNIVDFPNQEKRLDEASLWIARLDRELTEGEKLELSAWLDRDNENLETLMRLAELWDKMDRLSLLSEIFHIQPRKNPSTLRFAVAASFFMVCIGIFLMLQLIPSVSEDGSISPSVYQTAVGEQRKIFLEDGSTLVLNTNSQVEVIYSAEQRLLLLNRGEMHIDVAHDKSRPLRVLAQDKIVQAVGTAFDVRLLDSRRVKLWVTEGKVLVADNKEAKNPEAMKKIQSHPDSLFISKGEKAILSGINRKVEKISEGDMSAQLSWQQGNIVFRGETLDEAVLEFSRYSDKNFVIKDPSLRSVRIAGVFKIGDTSSLLSTLKNNFDIQYEYTKGNTIFLSADVK
jgi:transmembrane sensor